MSVKKSKSITFSPIILDNDYNKAAKALIKLSKDTAQYQYEQGCIVLGMVYDSLQELSLSFKPDKVTKMYIDSNERTAIVAYFLYELGKELGDSKYLDSVEEIKNKNKMIKNPLSFLANNKFLELDVKKVQKNSKKSAKGFRICTDEYNIGREKGSSQKTMPGGATMTKQTKKPSIKNNDKRTHKERIIDMLMMDTGSLTIPELASLLGVSNQGMLHNMIRDLASDKKIRRIKDKNGRIKVWVQKRNAKNTPLKTR